MRVLKTMGLPTVAKSRVIFSPLKIFFRAGRRALNLSIVGRNTHVSTWLFPEIELAANARAERRNKPVTTRSRDEQRFLRLQSISGRRRAWRP